MRYFCIGWGQPSSIVVTGGCHKVSRILDVEWVSVFVCFISQLATLVAFTKRVEWSGVFPTCLFSPSLFFPTLSNPPLPPSPPSASSLPRLLSTCFCPSLFFRSLKSLPSADVYPRPLHHQLHLCLAQPHYRVSGHDSMGMGIARGEALVRFQRSLKNKVEDEIEGRSPGSDRGVADGQ